VLSASYHTHWGLNCTHNLVYSEILYASPGRPKNNPVRWMELANRTRWRCFPIRPLPSISSSRLQSWRILMCHSPWTCRSVSDASHNWPAHTLWDIWFQVIDDYFLTGGRGKVCFWGKDHKKNGAFVAKNLKVKNASCYRFLVYLLLRSQIYDWHALYACVTPLDWPHLEHN
jgi:hypothetical protein